ncbi:MAG: heme ABC transporter permease [Rhodothermaceae bacterium]|nr:heme ABC transporter permease [Rhodothermaceae bacterium]MBC15194.1 heme ABC transporter permease [Rhodothermaceae bacterium]
MSAVASLALAFDHASDEAPVDGAAALARAAEHRARRVRLALGGLSAALIVACVISVGVGAVRVPPSAVLAALAGALGLDVAGGTAQQEAVLLAIRLPRVLLGVLVGAGLAVSGALMQGLFRNPLADPGLVGVSSGAALGAATAIVLASTVGVTALALGPALVALAAFAGGLATTAVVYRIATRGGRTSVATMLLAGIAVNALCGASVGVLVLFADDGQLRDLTFWTLGSLGGATWGTLAVVAPLIGAVVLAAPRLARPLNALLLGEAEAGHLGVRTERVKGLVVVGSALAVGVATAAAGLVGFIGLVAPHLVRLGLGPDHRALLPASALTGALLLVAADLLARTVLAPVEVPIGIVTALAGAPFFLWLLLRQRPAL